MKNKKLAILLQASDARRIMKNLLEEYDLFPSPTCKMFLCPYGADEIDETTPIINDNEERSLPKFAKHEKFAVIFLLYKKYGLVPMFPSELIEISFFKTLPIKRNIGEVLEKMNLPEQPDFAIIAGTMIQNSGTPVEGLFIHEFGPTKIFDRRITNPQKVVKQFSDYLYDVMGNPLPKDFQEPIIEPPSSELDEDEETVFMKEIIEKMTSCKGDPTTPSSEDLLDDDVEY